jgi:hypothetical protein
MFQMMYPQITYLLFRTTHPQIPSDLLGGKQDPDARGPGPRTSATSRTDLRGLRSLAGYQRRRGNRCVRAALNPARPRG